jgi:hypothetical protein
MKCLTSYEGLMKYCLGCSALQSFETTGRKPISVIINCTMEKCKK